MSLMNIQHIFVAFHMYDLFLFLPLLSPYFFRSFLFSAQQLYRYTAFMVVAGFLWHFLSIKRRLRASTYCINTRSYGSFNLNVG